MGQENDSPGKSKRKVSRREASRNKRGGALHRFYIFLEKMEPLKNKNVIKASIVRK